MHCYCTSYRKKQKGITVLNIFSLIGNRGLILHIFTVDVYSFFIIWSSRLCFGLSMAGLDNYAPMGVGHIWNWARLASLSRHFNRVFYKSYACLYLAIALMLIGWSDGPLAVQLPAKLSEHLWCEFCTCIWNFWFRVSILSKYHFGHLYQVICCKAANLLHNWEFSISSLQCIEAFY